jgi:hypothetical protein
MKDRQIQLDGGEPRIPFVSAALHCVAMTVLVFLRSSFGFVYLRPKSVFFAFSWAFVLFSIYAWNEPDVWSEYRPVCIFGAAAMSLYWIHLFVALSGQWREKGPHDRYSGDSSALRLMRRAGLSPTASLERRLHLWAEPAAVLVAAAAFRFVFGEHHLSKWLFFVAGCFWCKEALNRWFELRQAKRQKDIFDDATDTPEAPSATILGQEPPKATRKEAVKRKRNPASAEEAARERRFVELLRLRQPYTLEKAEENYLTLIKLEHPDATDQSPESNARAAELNEAIDFFRARLRG